MKRWLKVIFLTFYLSIVFGQAIHDDDNAMDAIAHVHRIHTKAKKYTEVENTRDTALLNSLHKYTDVNHAIARAEELLAARDRPHNVSSTCREEIDWFLAGIRNETKWAKSMLDAFGKPGSDLMNFHLTWLGSYEECTAVREDPVIGPPFSGRYCMISYTPAGQPRSPIAVNIGLCFPDSCSSEDAGQLVTELLSLVQLNMTAFTQSRAQCQLATLEYSTKAMAVIVVCCIFVAVMVAATVYDLALHWLSSQVAQASKETENYAAATDITPLLNGHQNGHAHYVNGTYHSADKQRVAASQGEENSHTPGILGKMLLSFSVYTNAPKIFNTNQPAGTLTAVNGVRFYSMLWVILGHTYAFVVTYSDNYVTALPMWMKRFSFQAISNATFAVDTFFVLSGLLVSYLTLKEMRKRDGVRKFKWGMFYFHRFWRLTPPYMLFLMLYVPLIKYWGNGPAWSQQGVEIDECEESWWRNILYINNLYKPSKMCMAWSWYLSNDMQFYVISPVFLIPLYYSGLLGTIVSAMFIIGCFIVTGVISTHYKLSANLIIGDEETSFNDVYVKPWCRIGPYAVGMVTGYCLYITDCKLRINKSLNVLGWLIAAAVSMSCLYGLYKPDGSAGANLSVEVAALYNATSRTAWGACIAWVIFACGTGNGGPINSLLSWRAIIPLSRLTYCAYLVHPVIMYVYYMSRHTLIHLDNLQMIYLFLGNTCLAYAAAFVISLAFESPMMGLEKVLLGRSKNS